MNARFLALLTIAVAGLTANSQTVTPTPTPAQTEISSDEAQSGTTPPPLATPTPAPPIAPTPASTPAPTPAAMLSLSVIPGYTPPLPTVQNMNGVAARVVRPRLDSDRPATVRISVEEDTLLTFPHPIEAIYGNKFARKAEERTVSKFVLSYKDGKAYCALRSLRPEATGTLSIVLDGRPYVVVCETVPETERDFSVIFTEAGTLPSGEPPRPPTDAPPQLPYKPASPGRVNGLIDKLKAFPTFREANPLMFTGLDVAEPHKEVAIPGVRAEIRRVMRDNAIDTVGFEVGLSNTSSTPYFYDPESFNVRVGSEVYTQSFADASGRIGPGQTTTAYFTVTGSGDGSRNDLSVNNDFTIAFNKIVAGAATSTATTERRTTATKRTTSDRSK
jgi:hypothetical protein